MQDFSLARHSAVIVIAAHDANIPVQMRETEMRGRCAAKAPATYITLT
jgi:hypothetical protein